MLFSGLFGLTLEAFIPVAIITFFMVLGIWYVLIFFFFFSFAIILSVVGENSHNDSVWTLSEQ